MLLYDCAYRPNGTYNHTEPSFLYDAYKATNSNEEERKVSKIFRQIADSIPSYRWGLYSDSESGATPENILIGLKRIGFKYAQLVPYDLEKLYKNLSFTRKDFTNREQTYNRGVLLFGYKRGGGHIWFCDGYYERSYKVTKKFLFVKLKSWTEYDDRLYMNWGWGIWNGWYKASDDTWTTNDPKGKEQPYKIAPHMFINLHVYDNPKTTVKPHEDDLDSDAIADL